MPLLIKKQVDSFGIIALWKVEENNQKLEELLTRLSNFSGIPSHLNHHYRITEWCVIRLLLAEIFEKPLFYELIYDENGKPYLPDRLNHISISHTKEYVAVMVNENKPVGIDIEIISPRIEKIVHKFISEEEKKWIQSSNYLEQLYIIWGAKEVLFKLYSKGGIDFKKHLEVEPFNFSYKGNLSGNFKKGFIKTYQMQYEKMNELMIVYGIPG